MNKICVIEDEKNIRDELGTFLKRCGYSVDAPEDFEHVIDFVRESEPSLVLLDINLPVFDGYYICREIRKFSQVPVIVVTSRNSDIDELMSMNLGADDFITKPYNPQILLARIEAILKRVYKHGAALETLNYDGLTINLANGSMTYNNKTLELTKNEIKILSYLIKNKGKIVTREKLMNYLWDCEMFIDDNTLSVNVTRIRKKFVELGFRNAIETRRGLGYIMS